MLETLPQERKHLRGGLSSMTVNASSLGPDLDHIRGKGVCRNDRAFSH
mgnify:CR=1 FL=1